MIHEMRLFEEPFEKIKSGVKDIEVRLFDQKRRKVRVGDKIIFRKLPGEQEVITVLVVGLSIFSSFKELFTNFDNARFGNDVSVSQQLTRIRRFYSQEAERENGVVGIHIKLLH